MGRLFDQHMDAPSLPLLVGRDLETAKKKNTQRERGIELGLDPKKIGLNAYLKEVKLKVALVAVNRRSMRVAKTLV